MLFDVSAYLSASIEPGVSFGTYSKQFLCAVLNTYRYFRACAC